MNESPVWAYILVVMVFIAFIVLLIYSEHQQYMSCWEKCKPNAVDHFGGDLCICDLTKLVK